MGVVSVVVFFLRAVLDDRGALAAENLALRQQFIVLQRSVKRVRTEYSIRRVWGHK